MGCLAKLTTSRRSKSTAPRRARPLVPAPCRGEIGGVRALVISRVYADPAARGKLRALAGLGVTVAAAVPDRWVPAGLTQQQQTSWGDEGGVRTVPVPIRGSALAGGGPVLARRDRAQPAHRFPARDRADRGGAVEQRRRRRRAGRRGGSRSPTCCSRARASRFRAARSRSAPAEPRAGRRRRAHLGQRARGPPCPSRASLAAAPHHPAARRAAPARTPRRTASRPGHRLRRPAGPGEGTRPAVPRRPSSWWAGGRSPSSAPAPRRRSWKGLAERLGIAGRVTWLGALPAERRGRGLAPARRGGRCPRAPRRAGSRWPRAPRSRPWPTGSPVVGSAAGAIPETVGDAGLIVPEEDVGALGDALQRLHDDPAEHQRLGAAGRRRVMDAYTDAAIAAANARLLARPASRNRLTSPYLRAIFALHAHSVSRRPPPARVWLCPGGCALGAPVTPRRRSQQVPPGSSSPRPIRRRSCCATSRSWSEQLRQRLAAVGPDARPGARRGSAPPATPRTCSTTTSRARTPPQPCRSAPARSTPSARWAS